MVSSVGLLHEARSRLWDAAAVDREAREAADEARRSLREAAVEAVASGVPIAEVARYAGVTRPVVYRWVEAAGE